MKFEKQIICSFTEAMVSLRHHLRWVRSKKVISVRSVIAGFLHSWKLETRQQSRLGVCSASQSSQSLCNPVDCGPPGSSVHGVFPARLLEWVAVSHSRWPLDPGIEPGSLASPALAGGFFTTVPPGKLRIKIYCPNIPSFTSLPSKAPNQAKFGYLDRLWKARFSCFHFQI